MLTIFLVDGVDPLFSLTLYVAAMSVAWWLGGEITRQPKRVVIPANANGQAVASESSADSPLQEVARLKIHIPVWDDKGEPRQAIEVPVVVHRDESAAGNTEGRVVAMSEAEAVTSQRFDLSSVKIFKLRKADVVRVTDLAFSIPDSIRRYKLRKKAVVRVADLRAAQLVV